MAGQKFIIYADGGARGNPGPSAIGAVIRYGKGTLLKKYSGFLGSRTNNEAEYEAVIFGLKKIKQLIGKAKTQKAEIEFRLDSQLVGRQLEGEYKIEEERLFPLFIKIWNLKMDFGKVFFNLVPREKNREPDLLVNQELDKKEQGSIF